MSRVKFDRSSLLIIIYCLFVLLYTLYGIHIFRYGAQKGGEWWYFIKFLLISGYIFFLIQGLILRSANWGIVLLLPLGVMLTSAIVLFLMVWTIRWGGGNLLDRDGPDMLLGSLLFLAASIYALRYIRGGKKKR